MKIFFVDLPDLTCAGDKEGSYYNLATLKSREEAYEYLSHWGIPPHIADFFISEDEVDDADGEMMIGDRWRDGD